MARCLIVFPSKGIGGVEVLFFRISAILLKQGWSISVVDYDGGTISKLLTERGLSFEKTVVNEWFKGRDVGLMTKEDFILTCTRDMFWIGNLKIQGSPKLLLWELHKNFWLKNSRDKFPVFYWKKAVACCLKKKSLLVLESDSIKAMGIAGFSHHPVPSIVPIVVDGFAETYRHFSPSNVRVASVGRADVEKIIPLAWAWPKIKKKFGVTATFTFITDRRDAAEELMRKLGMDFEGVTLVDGLRGQGLDDYLSHNVDVYIGMGTTLLEAGKLGIPSIIVDGGSDDYPELARVRLLHENKLENLGSPEPSLSGGYSLNNALDEILSDYEYISSRTLEYVRSHHEELSVAASLDRAIESSSLSFDAWTKSVAYKWFHFSVVGRRLMRLLTTRLIKS